MDLYAALKSLIDSDTLPGKWRMTQCLAYRDGNHVKRMFAVIRNVDEPSQRLEFVLKFRDGGYRCVRARLMHHTRLMLLREVI